MEENRNFEIPDELEEDNENDFADSGRGLDETTAKEISNIITVFLASYAEKKENVTDAEWIEKTLQKEIPGMSSSEAQKQTQDILSGIDKFEENLNDLNTACKRGIPKEDWFSERVIHSSESASFNRFGEYLTNIDRTLAKNNQEMLDTIMTNGGKVSQNKNLDGYIFEQEHANSFNRNAALEGEHFRAKVLKPNGKGYAKNSVDVEIFDTDTGKVVHKYQAKVGKTAVDTSNLAKKGDYRNQRLLVGEGQVSDVKKDFPNKTVTDRLGGTNKVKVQSDPVSKLKVKQEQVKVQQGKSFTKDSWNSFKLKEVAKNVGKQAAIAALISAALSTVVYAGAKKLKGEKIKRGEILRFALTSGADAGVKAALTGALKVAVGKGLIPFIPQGTPTGVIAAFACVAVEHIKTIWKYSNGDISGLQALDKMARSTLTMGLGLLAVGLTIPAEASFVVMFFGGIVVYAIGEKVGDWTYSGLKKLAPLAQKMAESEWKTVKENSTLIANRINNLVFN